MRWRGRRQSRNIEDLRGAGGRSAGGRGGFGRGLGGGLGDILSGGRRQRQRPGGRGMRVGRKSGIGLVGILLFVGVSLLMGGDLGSILGGLMGGGGGQIAYQAPQSTGQSTGVRQTGRQTEDEQANFVAVVLADTEDVWHKIFEENGGRYEEPKLTLFTGAVQSACGLGQAAMGPFYCPGDRKIYIDLSFYSDLQQRFGAPGDFAQAYVIAHEVGHHVQTLIGVSEKVQSEKRRASQAAANAIQVRMELQADCFAGLWANRAERAKAILESGDLNEAMNAAAAIGDDRLQRQAQGRVVPESFTHGTSEQRQRWFRRGFDKGQVAACDTFSASNL